MTSSTYTVLFLTTTGYLLITTCCPVLTPCWCGGEYLATSHAVSIHQYDVYPYCILLPMSMDELNTTDSSSTCSLLVLVVVLVYLNLVALMLLLLLVVLLLRGYLSMLLVVCVPHY